MTASPTLTPRQRQVLSLRAAGLTYAQIADQLGIGVRTVKFHLRNGGEVVLCGEPRTRGWVMRAVVTN